MRARGLKLPEGPEHRGYSGVAPHAGAWIETRYSPRGGRGRGVAPHAGAWIETRKLTATERPITVAPHAGAWIETLFEDLAEADARCRAPCGRVD